MSRWEIVVLLLFVLGSPAWGYIDPGTGSMLFSALSGVAAAVYFFFRGLVVRLRSLPERWKGSRATAEDRSEALVIFSEGKQYWNLFRPVLEELDRQSIVALYASADPDDPGLEFKSATVRTSFWGRGNAAYWKLNVLEADVCLATTPGLQVYHWKRSPKVKRYVHLLHAPNDATLYRLFGLDYYDAVLLTGDHQREGIRALEALRKLPPKDLITVGCPYLDVLRSRLDSAVSREPRTGTTVLVAPSWGPNGLLTRFGMELLGPLAASGLEVVVRPHPQSKLSEAGMLSALRAQTEGLSVEWDDDRDNLAAMARADVLVSDFSGILFDYLFLFGRSVFYTKTGFDMRPYDAHHLGGKTWTFEVLDRLGREISDGDLPRLGSLVREHAQDESRREAMAVLREQCWAHQGTSAREIVQALRHTKGDN